jgi:hypothetical protein
MLTAIVDAVRGRWSVSLQPLGAIDHDAAVEEATLWRRPLLKTYPAAPVSASIGEIGDRLLRRLGLEASQ